MTNVWIFSNNHEDYYGDSDWDTSTILKSGHYYFKQTENNRAKVRKGDSVLLREYGTGFWGSTFIEDDWVVDPEAMKKHKLEAGWFPISKVKNLKVKLPYELIRTELSNKGHRSRIATATDEDKEKIELVSKIYRKLGYGEADGTFFVLENGIEEAVKVNLSKLQLRPAEEEIQQQCDLGIGIGRTDLICRDKNDNYVVLELKVGQSSDAVIGQIMRYMGYIRENWASKEGKEVKGIVLSPSYDEHLYYAAQEAPNIQVLHLRIV